MTLRTMMWITCHSLSGLLGSVQDKNKVMKVIRENECRTPINFIGQNLNSSSPKLIC